MARNIENAMVAAIRAGKAFNGGNTVVVQEPEGARVYLFGNLIAKIPNAGVPEWSLAGWNTVTTRSRVNALARAFNWRGVCQRNRSPVADGLGKIGDKDWIPAFDENAAVAGAVTGGLVAASA